MSFARILTSFVLLAVVACGRPAPLTSHPSGDEAALTQESASALQAMLDDYALYAGEGGVAMTVMKGGATWHGVAGQGDLVTHAALAPDARFRVGSNTKLILAAIAMQLVEEGKLSLDATLAELLPQYPAWSGVTVRELIGMRAGLPEYLRAPKLWAKLSLAPAAKRDPNDLLALVKDEPFVYEPGTSCAYSNTNYLLAGLVLEKAGQRPLPALIAERVTGPLGLTDTTLDADGGEQPRLARGYLDVGLGAPAWGVPSLLYYTFHANERLGDGVVDATYHYHPSVAGAAGAVVSTPDDMAAIVRALGEGRLVSAASLAAMRDVRACELNGQHFDYGLGLFQFASPRGTIFGHEGLIFGYRTHTYWSSEAQLSFSMMANYYPHQGDALLNEVVTLAAAAPAEAPKTCRPPEGAFEATTDGYLVLRYRGGLDGSGGVGTLRSRALGHPQPYFGVAPVAGARGADGAWRFSGTGAGGGFGGGNLRATVALPPATRATLASGTVTELAGGDAAAPVAYVEELKNGQACLTAVADPGPRPAFLLTCDRETAGTAADPARIFAKVPLTRSAAAIDALAQTLGRPRCVPE